MLSLVLLVVVSPGPAAGAPHTKSGEATVKNGPVQVHSEPSSKSKVLRSLSAGTAVTIEIEIGTSDDAWCGITEEGTSSLTGYVPCRFLERKTMPMGWKFIGSKEDANNPPKPPPVRSAASPEKAKRPYSDITVLLYMTTW